MVPRDGGLRLGIQRPGQVALTAFALAYLAGSLLLMAVSRAHTTYAATSPLAAAATGGAGVLLIGGGLIASWIRTTVPLGPATLRLGVVWLAPLWVGWQGAPPAMRSVAMVVVPFELFLLVWLATGWRADRARSRWVRPLLVSVAFITVVYTVTRALVRDPFRDLYCWSNCRDNVFLVASSPGLARTIDRAWLGVLVVAGSVAAVLASIQLAAQSPVGRRLAWPELVPVGCASIALSGQAALLLMDPAEDPSDPRFRTMFLILAATLACVGLGVGWVALRQRRARAAVVDLSADLAMAPAAGSLRTSLAEALGDPGLTVAYPIPQEGRLVDADGRPAPDPGPRQFVTPSSETVR